MALIDEFTENGLTEEEQAVMDEIDAENNSNTEEAEEATETSITEAATEENIESVDVENTEEDSEEKLEAEESTKDVGQFIPEYSTGNETDEEAKATADSIESDATNLRQQLDDGEIELDQFLKEQESITLRKAEVATQQAIHSNNQQNNDDLKAQLWAHDQKVFFENKDNKVFDDNPVLFGALDSTVKAIANDPDFLGKSGAWVLNEAKTRVLNTFSNKTDNKKEASIKPIVKAEEKEIPITLANIPASSENETVKDEFSHIDALIESGDVNAMERALAAMTDDQQSRYLSQTTA